MGRVTLFELHSHGNVQIGPSKVPGIGSTDEIEEDEQAFAADDEESGGGRGLRVLIGLVALVAIAAVVRKYRSSSDEEVPLVETDEAMSTQT